MKVAADQGPADTIHAATQPLGHIIDPALPQLSKSARKKAAKLERIAAHKQAKATKLALPTERPPMEASADGDFCGANATADDGSGARAGGAIPGAG
eukprot:SAG11_NODE_19978_length_455_cov_0.713483_1_plen_96_part_10